MRCKRALVVLFAFGVVLAGCGGDDEAASVPAERKSAVAERYVDLVYAAYGSSVASAEQMRERIDGFLERPTTARLASARKAWIDARDDYVVTEPFRFYGGPIDDPKTGPEGLINAWPMDEAYVDYVAGDPQAGIVNDRDGVPEDHRGRDRREQRAGRRDEHLLGLARDRVPALGPGPLEGRPRRAAGERLHDGAPTRGAARPTCG